MFFFVFHKIQSKKSTSRDKIRKRQKNKSNRERKTNSVWLCLILPKCAGSVNCARADRVTSNINRAHFRFLWMLKETRHFIKSSLFRWISIKANVGKIAMHSFFKITNFLIFWNSLKSWPFINETKSMHSVMRI